MWILVSIFMLTRGDILMRKKLINLLFSIVMTVTLSGVTAHAESTQAISQDKPKLRMPVMSDIHLRYKDQSDRFIRALEDYKKIAPDYQAIAFVGDITEMGSEYQYDDFMKIIGEYANKDAEKIAALGNHEYVELMYGIKASDDVFKNRFVTKTKMPKIYYDKWVNGYHFITLSGEVFNNSNINDAIISDEQYSWLEKTLPVKSDPKKPIFVFLHQPITNTVYGSELYHGNLNDGRLLNILKKYPQVIFFSGHSHNLVQHPRTVYQDGFTMVNTGSVAYSWYNGGAGPESFSQGLLVDVYDDKVVIGAREFSTGKWLKTYTVKLPFENTIMERINPFFSFNTKATVEDIGADNATISWEQAIDDMIVDKYLVKQDGKTIHTEYIKFWDIKRPNKVTAYIENLKPTTEYNLEIFAVDGWNKESTNSIKVKFTTGKPKGWFKVDNKQYYYDPVTFEMKTGWILSGSKWYYFGKDGVMQTGLITDSDKKYYLAQDGTMKTGWLFLGDDRYYLDEYGAAKTGWLFEGDRWYCFDKNGVMKTGWFKEEEKTYYAAPNGAIKTGSTVIDGKVYNFDSRGILKK